MSSYEREQRLEKIRDIQDRLEATAESYKRLRWMAEEEQASEAFLGLAEAAGDLALDSLSRLRELLGILHNAQFKERTE